MKLNNQDVIRLTEIRIYFLDPPYSYKLNGYAMTQVEESIHILQKYPAAAVLVDQMETFKPLLQSSESNINTTMETMKQFAVLLKQINR